MAKYLTEFIGTFFLCLTVGLTVVTGHSMPGLPIGASLMVMVYMGGPISGGHYNPAVSLAASIRGALPWPLLLPYMVSQLLGALAAAVITGVATGDIASAAPAPDTSILVALLIEFLFTFALALVVLNVATSKRSQGNSYFGLAIGFTIVVAAAAGGGLSGGAFNPAVGVGLGLVDGILGGAPMNHLWLYVVGPFLGGIVAAYVFRFQESAP
jgi:aquaporin Z